MRRPLRIACVGGGPAGLYFAVLAKQADPARRVTVFERNRPGDTFGFGVVFSDHAMGFLAEQDHRSYPEIMARSTRWDPITVVHGGRTLRCRGVGFSAIERRELLGILQRQARRLGVELRFESEVPALPPEGEADLIVAADGVNSGVRAALADRVGTTIEVGPTRFAWLGTTKPFDSLTFFFEENEHGVFGAHVYPYRPDRSTFIVEADEGAWRRAGMEAFVEDDTRAYCERLFARHLDGHRLLSNRSLWVPFRTVRNRRWHDGNVVLIGDAAHTAHFSVGSGTKMAMEDALALAQALARCGSVADALVVFEEERRPRVEHIQRMAAASFDWWATFRHYVPLPAERFAFHFLTRSQFRYDTLRARDPEFVTIVENAVPLASLGDHAIAPVVPAGTARDGMPDAATADRLLALAGEGVHTVLTEPVAISADGRITPGDPGLYTDAQVAAWRGIVAAVHAAGSRVGVELGHAGPRGATRPRAGGLDRPLETDEWPLVAASPRPYAPDGRVPRALDRAGMAAVRDAFAAAARRAAGAGFDLLQLHFGHGYLVASFLSPLTNHRGDEHGGGIDHRLRFALEVLAAVRATWPPARRLLVAFSATDWEPGGLAPADALHAARAFRDHGADLVTVLGGQTTWRSGPPYGRCFQMSIAGRIRHEAGVAVVAAGGITDADDVKTVLLSGRADLCLLDRVRARRLA